jgi:hypothetical protein
MRRVARCRMEHGLKMGSQLSRAGTRIVGGSEWWGKAVAARRSVGAVAIREWVQSRCRFESKSDRRFFVCFEQRERPRN